MYGPTHQVQSPLCSADGQVLFTDKASILSCWSEHFQSLFSADHVVQDPPLLYISQQPFKAELPSTKEITKVLEHLRRGKAAGVDKIPPEPWKEGGPALHSKLHEFFVCCWEQGKLPSDPCDAIIVTLYKNKGKKSDCSNYREITLISIIGKILACVLLTNWYPPSLKKSSVGSKPTGALQIWCLSSDSSRRIAGSRTKKSSCSLTSSLLTILPSLPTQKKPCST